MFFSLDLLILLSVHLVRCRSAPLGGFRRVSCVPADTRRIAARGYPCPRQRVSGLSQRPWTPVHPVMAAPLGNHDAGVSLGGPAEEGAQQIRSLELEARQSSVVVPAT